MSVGELPRCGCGLPIRRLPVDTAVRAVALSQHNYAQTPDGKLFCQSALLDLALVCLVCRRLVNLAIFLVPLETKSVEEQFSDWQAIVSPALFFPSKT